VVPDDRIEREILIDAPPNVVWDLLTDPAKVALWFSDSADFASQPGADGSLTFRSGLEVPIRVWQVEPERYFSFYWSHPAGEEPGPRNATIVEFILVAHGAGTRLRLVERGIAGLDRPESELDEFRGSHASGWDEAIARLKERAEQRRAARA
jgi:uncharacterized protein YndB with AHSA1/START domain